MKTILKTRGFVYNATNKKRKIKLNLQAFLIKVCFKRKYKNGFTPDHKDVHISIDGYSFVTVNIPFWNRGRVIIDKNGFIPMMYSTMICNKTFYL